MRFILEEIYKNPYIIAIAYAVLQSIYSLLTRSKRKRQNNEAARRHIEQAGFDADKTYISFNGSSQRSVFEIMNFSDEAFSQHVFTKNGLSWLNNGEPKLTKAQLVKYSEMDYLLKSGIVDGYQLYLKNSRDSAWNELATQVSFNAGQYMKVSSYLSGSPRSSNTKQEILDEFERRSILITDQVDKKRGSRLIRYLIGALVLVTIFMAIMLRIL